jgi:hypothetical protein
VGTIGDFFSRPTGASHRYNGVNSNRYEKAKGAEMVRKIHDERGARGTVVRARGDS